MKWDRFPGRSRSITHVINDIILFLIANTPTFGGDYFFGIDSDKGYLF